MPTLPTAYIARQGSRVRLDGGCLLIEHPEHPAARLQLGLVGAVVALGSIDFTTAALTALADRGIGCAFASRTGRLRAAVLAPSARHQSLRARQHRLEAERAAHDAGAAAPRVLTLARATIHAKLDAQLGLLTQHHRTHDDIDLAGPIAVIRALQDRSANADSIERLRGYEGAAAARYFAAMPALCRTELTTATRSRQPPQDEVNAALSFGYSLLVNELTTTLHARGLDPGLGLLHPPADGRPSLALDLIEPLRHAIVDRLVLRAANRRELRPTDFERAADHDPDDEPRGEASHAQGRTGIRFTDAGRARFLGLYHDAMCAGLGEGPSATSRNARSLIGAVVEGYELALGADGAPETAPPSDSASIAVR